MGLSSIALVVVFVLIWRNQTHLRRLERRLEMLEGARREPGWEQATTAPARPVERSYEPVWRPVTPKAAALRPARTFVPEPEPRPVVEAARAEIATVSTAPPVSDAPPLATPISPAPVPPAPVPPHRSVSASPISRASAQPRRGWSFNFEDLFGRRLPIWAGGITLAIAGVLIVKYAIDAGLLSIFTPTVRVICALLFGGGLIGGAEIALRNEERVNDPRVRQALSGAGIATLYAALLMAANGYHLVGAATAFAGLAAVTGAALALSIRFGAPSAVLGLAGGLAAPAMVGGLAPNVPMLAIYLALAIAGLAGVSRMQRWAWLAVLALLGGAGWSVTMALASNAFTTASTFSVGSFILLLTVGLPVFVLDGPRSALLRTASALLGAAQLALMVALGGFAVLNWGLFILLAAAAQWLAWRDKQLAILPTISLPLSAILLAIWPHPAWETFALVGLPLAIVHAGPLMWKLWRSPPAVQRAIELSGLALAGWALIMLHYFRPERQDVLAIGALFSSLVPVLGMASGWTRTDRQGDTRFAWLTTTAAGLIGCAALLALPQWLWPVAIGGIAAMLLLFGVPARDRRVEAIASFFAGVALFGMLYQLLLWGDVQHLFTGAGIAVDNHALVRWSALAILFWLFATRAVDGMVRRTGFGLCGALIYGAAAHIVPGWALPMALAAIASAMRLLAERRGCAAERLQAAAFAVATIPLLAITDRVGFPEWTRLVGFDQGGSALISPVRWAVVTILGVLFAARAQSRVVAIGAQVLAAAVGYGAVAQVVPAGYLPLIAPLAIVGLALWSRGSGSARMVPAAATLLVIVGYWAIVPVSQWTAGAILSLVGRPMIIAASVPAVVVIAKQVILPAMLLGAALALARGTLRRADWTLAAAIAATLGMIGVHTLYRLGFAQLVGADFVTFGLAQRLVWAGALIGLGWWLFRGENSRPFALALVAAGTLHAIWYSLVLHDPLWSTQAVGAVPVGNLLIPLAAVPCAGVIALRRMMPAWTAPTRRPVQFAAMAMVAGFAWATLRQMFHGTLLTGPGVTPAENILRSLLAIALAVGFLQWGIRAQLRDWRIASLCLIIAAVAKVFILDAAGLAGLLRIGSFVALGFSLIGIGWLYSRQLKENAAPQTAAALT